MSDYSTFTKNALRDTGDLLIETFIKLWPALMPILIVFAIGLIITLIRKSFVRWFSNLTSVSRQDARQREKTINGLFDLFSAFRDVFSRK